VRASGQTSVPKKQRQLQLPNLKAQGNKRAASGTLTRVTADGVWDLIVDPDPNALTTALGLRASVREIKSAALPEREPAVKLAMPTVVKLASALMVVQVEGAVPSRYLVVVRGEEDSLPTLGKGQQPGYIVGEFKDLKEAEEFFDNYIDIWKGQPRPRGFPLAGDCQCLQDCEAQYRSDGAWCAAIAGACHSVAVGAFLVCGGTPPCLALYLGANALCNLELVHCSQGAQSDRNTCRRSCRPL
jgi:hypothetical protein